MSRYDGAAARLLAAALLAGALAGCTAEAMQHSDRIRYGAGNAVRANLESETVNPSSGAMYRTDGLGADGAVIPSAGGAEASADAGTAAPSP